MAVLDRALDALCMGRSRNAVLAEIAALHALAGMGWIAVALFFALEPMP